MSDEAGAAKREPSPYTKLAREGPYGPGIGSL